MIKEVKVLLDSTIGDFPCDTYGFELALNEEFEKYNNGEYILHGYKSLEFEPHIKDEFILNIGEGYEKLWNDEDEKIIKLKMVKDQSTDDKHLLLDVLNMDSGYKYHLFLTHNDESLKGIFGDTIYQKVVIE